MGTRSTEIGNELMRLFERQTEFLGKTAPTPEELSEYERWRERTRELFAELEQLAKAEMICRPRGPHNGKRVFNHRAGVLNR